MAAIVVKNGGVDAANGTYRDIGKNIFQLESNDPTNVKTYRIQLDSSQEATGFGNCLLLTETRSGQAPVTLYLSQKAASVDGSIDFANLDNNWVCIAGIDPPPSFNKIEAKGDKSNTNNKFVEYFDKEKEIKRTTFLQKFAKKGKKKNKDDKFASVDENRQVLYWSRKFNNWTNGLISEINRKETTSNEYIVVETDLNCYYYSNESHTDHGDGANGANGGAKELKENEDVEVTSGATATATGLQRNLNELGKKEKEKYERYERLYIRVDSDFIRPFAMVKENCQTRKLKKGNGIAVWSRNELKWVKGVVKSVEQGYVFADCEEARWIQQDSCLIQAL